MDARFGAATTYDLTRGALNQFPVGTGAAETCRSSGVTGAWASDASVPAQGQGFWYLVRGRNACGTGSYGFRRNGTERTTAVCP
jgi:hypothetical protein